MAQEWIALERGFERRMAHFPRLTENENNQQQRTQRRSLHTMANSMSLPVAKAMTHKRMNGTFLCVHLVLLFLAVLVWTPVRSSEASYCMPDTGVVAETGCEALDNCGLVEGRNIYLKVTEPTLAGIHLQDLPGFTRSVYEREYALITPESQVYSPLPGWTNTFGAYLVTPAIGSHFNMYFAKMEGNSSSAQPLDNVERFIFVVQGGIQLKTEEFGEPVTYHMGVDGYAYLPGHTSHLLQSDASSTLIVFERRYLKGSNYEPKLIVGYTDAQPLLDTPGEVFALRKLLPSSSTYDFNIHVMDFQPGEYLNVKEVHYNQHGLVLLEGRGIYRLGKDWHPVQAGDVIWMAPFVPQWYAALGRTRSRYLLYKDVNRDPLLHPY